MERACPEESEETDEGESEVDDEAKDGPLDRLPELVDMNAVLHPDLVGEGTGDDGQERSSSLYDTSC